MHYWDSCREGQEWCFQTWTWSISFRCEFIAYFKPRLRWTTTNGKKTVENLRSTIWPSSSFLMLPLRVRLKTPHAKRRTLFQPNVCGARRYLNLVGMEVQGFQSNFRYILWLQELLLEKFTQIFDKKEITGHVWTWPGALSRASCDDCLFRHGLAGQKLGVKSKTAWRMGRIGNH